MSFFQLYEAITRKKLLLLVHPDCCIELGAEIARDYNTLLKSHAPKFDHVITHWFFDHDRSWSELWNPEQVQVYKELRDAIRAVSHVAVRRNTYACSYDHELPEYLIENKDTDIYMAGGYESNCLWISYNKLFKELDWLLKEQGHNVHYYKPLLFHNQGGWQGDKYAGGGLGSYGNYMKPSWRSEFHPSKVQYKEPE